MKLGERVDATALTDLGTTFTPDEMVEDLDQIVTSPVTLRELYHRWERTNWSAYELDFTADVEPWRALGDHVTERLLWVMSNFFHGEECVTASLAPWVQSAPTEEMQLFLSTQLADEARHTVFFDRFFDEVVGVSPGGLKARLDATHHRLNPGFDELFYDMLPRVADEVYRNPRDPVVFARGVAMYHILLEGSLAIPGQKYILAFCRDHDTLPTFRNGFTAVARDESRHVGAGVRILQECIAMDGDAVDAVQGLLREALPLAVQSFQPPGCDFTYLAVLGYDSVEVFRFGLESLNKRLRAAGVPFPRLEPFRLPQVDGEPILPDRQPTPVQELMRPLRDQMTPGMVFQGLPMAFQAEAAADISAHYAFEVTGAEGGEWTVRIHEGAIEVMDGPSPVPPDWKLTLDRDTWIGMATGDYIGQEAFLMGKVTLEGDPLAGMHFDRFFEPPAA